MANNLYTTKTAALKATKADISKLNTKKLFLGGENILDIIKRATPTIKHANDTRTTVTEYDLWGQWVETKDDGTVIVHDDWGSRIGNFHHNEGICKVEDNKVYTGEIDYYGNLSNLAFHANVQTNKIKDGSYMFSQSTALTSFSSDLSSLTNGYQMFYVCTALTSFNADLSSLTNGSYMFRGCSNFTSFNSDLSSLKNGNWMFDWCTTLTSFTGKLSSLTDGYSMFANCRNLSSFSSDLSSLTNGEKMFYDAKLTSFSSDLSSLTNGEKMFYDCENLTTFTSNLPNLTNGYEMFYLCKNLTTFSSDYSGSPVNLSSLTEGISMFAYSELSSFSSDLPSLTNGEWMFSNCFNLTSFSADLSSLTNGNFMFYNCKLDAESVMYIADSIKDIAAEKQLYTNDTIPYVTLSNGVYSAPKGFMSDGTYIYTYKKPQPYTDTIFRFYVGNLTLGINVTNNSSTIKQQLEDFAKAATFESWDVLKTYFSKKGWTVTFQYGGTTDTIPDEFPNTYDLRDGERIIPCSIFAKLVEAEKDSAEYCTEDASTFYNIEWGHDVTNYDDFQQFDSLEDAMVAYGVILNVSETEEEEA